MSPRPSIRALFSALLLSVALLALVAGCGGSSSDSGGKVSIETDTGPDGNPALISDAAAGPAHARVPITTKGAPTMIYEVPVRELSEGMHLRAIATVTLTKCEITDYEPNNRAHTACQGTRKYTYDPVEVETGFALADGDSASDLAAAKPLGPVKKTSCTTAVHHCTITADYETEVSSGDLSDDPKWVVFTATATSPKAKGCKPPKAADCNVLAVETQKGTAMYWVQADGNVSQPSKLPGDTSENVKELPVLINHGNKNGARKVIYSAELSPSDGFASLKGAQMEVDSLLKIGEKLPQAPDIAGYLVLSDSPTGISGRYLISDSYDPGKTGNAGGNCDRSCANGRPAVVTTILDCDVKAGRRYVNLVADGSRAAARAGEKVDVLDGGYVKVTHLYGAGVSVNADTSASCNR
jgi:hypothetical protein